MSLRVHIFSTSWLFKSWIATQCFHREFLLTSSNCYSESTWWRDYSNRNIISIFLSRDVGKSSKRKRDQERVHGRITAHVFYMIIFFFFNQFKSIYFFLITVKITETGFTILWNKMNYKILFFSKSLILFYHAAHVEDAKL